MNKLLLKSIITTKGWQEVVRIFDEEIFKSLMPENFHTAGKIPEIVAVECVAREKASKMVKDILNKITVAGNDKDLEKESWK